MQFLTKLIRKIKCKCGLHSWVLHSMQYDTSSTTSEHECKHCDATKEVYSRWA